MAKRAPKARNSLPTADLIERSISLVRGQRVMLDSDLAALYGTTTAALNQAVARNADRFPEDFSFLLAPQEVSDLISQSVISSPSHGGRRKLPRVFTKQGVAMLSSVLRSPTAVRVNIEIMRAFIRMRRLIATPGELVDQLRKLADSVQLHDRQIKTIADVLQRMIEEPPPAKRKIGFHVDSKRGQSHPAN